MPPPQPPTLDAIDGLISLATHAGAIREALHALKYENVREVATPIARHFAPLLHATGWQYEAIIPVPLHAQRLAERGYNQAQVLAEAFGAQSGHPVLSTALQRHKITQTQVDLNAHERRANVEDAFSIVGKVPSCVLLVDDVCTTGATLSAAAQTLKQAGVTLIYAATVSQAAMSASV